MNIDEFAKRRIRLMEMMGQNSIAILPAAPVSLRNRDIEYPYRQDSDFHYLTGFPEPEAIAILVPGRRHGEYLLFCRDRNSEFEQWTGPRAGQEGAHALYGADDAFPISDCDDIVPGLLEGREKVYYTMGYHADFDHKVIDWLNKVRQKSRSGITTPLEFVALDHLLHELRLFKGRNELARIRKACRITAAAHLRAIKACRAGIMEHHIEAELLHEFMSRGCRNPAYPSIVAGGANACILHYTANDAELEDGDLLLIDAGAEYENYAADVTRTFPVNGRFTPAQKALYEVVLTAQLAAIDKVRPGNHWNDPHHAAVRTLTRGLVKLGLLRGEVRKLVKEEAYRRFYPHRTGHWLGMDVHDVGDYKVNGAWRVLEPGMVLTVEPGLYIPSSAKGIAKRWRGIGIRIEDDVLVTRDGHEVLTRDLPKRVDEIEALMEK